MGRQVQALVCDGPHSDALLPKTPNLLKTLYDMDILEEDVIVKWYDSMVKLAGMLRPYLTTNSSLETESEG